MTLDIQALRKELSNPAIGSNAHLRKLALALLDELEAAEKRIAELESRTVTVKLAEDKPAESESEVDDAEAWFDEGWNARGEADRDALAAAGIQVIEGEGQ